MQGACVLLLLGLRLQLSLGLVPAEEEDPAFWNRQAAQALDVAKKLQPIQTAAKNVILFLGDGMGVSTVTATRILKGQMNGKPGPETPLAMDQFPFVALSKTYNVDRDVPDSAGTATAYLCGVKGNYGTIGVILGGGRMYMFPEGTPDPEYPHDANQTGVRKDKRNLVQEWQAKHQGAQYVWNRTALLQASTNSSVTHLMGLFEPVDMAYETQRDHNKDPSLEEMTEAALRVLSRNPQGFYLFVEGGRIDHGHHEGIAYRALTDAVMFDNAIAKANKLTSKLDTLILVTADHSHVFTFGGYPLRGTSIFGLADGKASDGKSYTSLLYSNGPGYQMNRGSRPDVDETKSRDPSYQQQAAVPLARETHGGEDVAVFARGPQAHLVHGVQEETFVAHVMAFAGCLEPYTDCHLPAPAHPTNTACQAACPPSLALLAGALLLLVAPGLH